MTWKTKFPLFLLSLIFVLYSIFWLKITSDMTNDINTRISGKVFNITLSHRIQFRKATAAGFPFILGVNLHEFKEDTAKALIYHKKPIFVGYNIFTKELFGQYDGESAIETKSTGDKKKLISNGKFRYSATLPISIEMLNQSSENKNTPLDMLGNIQNIKIQVQDASLLYAKDNTQIIDKANIDLELDVKHHRTYKTLDDLKNDIPKDYDFRVNVQTTNHLENSLSIPTSLIYGLYIPFNINYHLKTSLHTDATAFNVADIISNISLNDCESSMANDFEESSSKKNLSTNISLDQVKCEFDNISQIKFKPTYAKDLNENLKKALALIPPSFGSFVQSAIRQVDLSALNLDTQNDPLSITFKGSLSFADKMGNLSFDLTHFGVSFRDVSFDIKNTTQVNLKEDGKWSSIGVISAERYDSLVKYLIDSYFAIYHLPENVDFNSDFYLKMFMDFVHKIANSIKHDNSAITIEYDLQPDITKSMLGKFGRAEATLLYYSTLLKHISAVSKDFDKGLARFKTMVPSYVLEQEALDKIIIQSKE